MKAGFLFVCFVLVTSSVEAKQIFYSTMSCEVAAGSEDVGYSLEFLESTIAMQGAWENSKDFIYGAFCNRVEGGEFTVLAHPEAVESSAFARANRNGSESIRVFAVLRGCSFEAEFWKENETLKSEKTWSKSCVSGSNAEGWSVKYQIPSGNGVGYGIECGNGKEVVIQYSPELEPQGYFAALNATFSSLEEAVRYKCGT